MIGLVIFGRVVDGYMHCMAMWSLPMHCWVVGVDGWSERWGLFGLFLEFSFFKKSFNLPFWVICETFQEILLIFS